MPIGSQVIYNAGDLILSTVSSSGNTFVETKIAAATSSVILFNNSASLTSASLSSLTVGNASTASYVSPSGNAFVQGGNSFGTTATLGTNDASALIFETKGTGRVTIDANGYVGIAQPTPTAYLHVGQNTASDTNNYGIRIDKNGTLVSPGTYQNSAIYLSDLAGGGPSTVDVVGQVSLNFPRLQASDLSSSKVSHLIIAHDSALGPMRVDGKGNLWVGYDRNAANTSSNSFSTLIYGGLTVGSGYQTTTVSDGTAIFSGNVGIGTSDPKGTLHVIGNITASSVTASLFGTSSFATNASTASYISPSGNAFVQGGNSFGTTALLGTNDAQSLALETNGTTRMSINSNGNVAINTSTSPFYRLNIEDTHNGSLGSSSLFITTVQNQNQGLATSANDSGIHNVYYVNYFTSSTAIQNQAAFNQLYINGSGSFSGSYRASRNAINLSNTASLHSVGNIINTYLTNQISPNIPTFSIPDWIAGTGTFIDIITGNSTGSITNLYNHQIRSPFPSGGAGGITVTNSYGVYINKQKTTNIVTNGWGIYQADTGDLNIFAGKTRIGSTTTPVNTLDVTGNISASVVTASLFGTASWANNASTASYVSPSGNAFVQGGNSFGTTALLGTNDAQSLVLETSGSERIRIDSSGNVGIGTSIPVAVLNVKTSTVANREVFMGDSAAVSGVFRARLDDNSLSFISLENRDTTATTNHGVGIRFNLATNVSNNDINAGGIYLGKEQEWTATTSTQDSYLILNTALDGTASEKLRIQSNGNVGIGTTSSVNKLDVAGNISCSVMSSSFAYLSNIGFTNQTVASDTSVFPTGSVTGGFILDGGIYKNGLYRTRFVKIDRSANLPLYIQETQGSSGSFSNLARFGTHANSPNTFEVFGSTNIQGSLTSSNISSSNITTANITCSNITASGNIIASKITSSGILVNGNLTVTGSIFASLFSASYIYITSSQLVVTDNIITLNALSPYQRYAGMEMYDSGSGNLSSFLWDGQGDYFFVTGSGVNSKIIVGPDQQTNLTSGRLTKATGTNIIGDSIVSEDGNGITVSGYISGSSVMTANITCSNISASKTGSFGIVGIGTTNPSYLLHLKGGGIGVDRSNISSTAVTPILSVKMSGSGAVFNDIISIQNSTSADQSNLIIGHANGYGQSTFIGAGESATYASNLTGWGGEYLYLGADEGVVAVTNLQSGPAAAFYPFTISPSGSIRMQYQWSGSSWSGASDSYTLNVSGSNTQGLLYVQSPAAPNALFVSGSGNVGIGTTSPATFLDVVGVNGSFPATSGATQATGSILRLRNGNSNLVLDIGGNLGAGGNWLQSTNRNNLSLNYPILLNPNGGNVGIGTTSVETKFDVDISNSTTSGVVYENSIKIENIDTTVGNLSSIMFSQAGDGASAIAGIHTGRTPGSRTSDLALYSYIQSSGGTVERIRILSNGNVGIGTTSPVTLLTVGSTTTTTSSMTLQGEYQSSVFNNTNIFNFRHGGLDRWRLLTTQNSAASNDFDFRINSLNSAATDYNAYVTVKGLSGNVGIGVTNPSGRLHITASATSAESLIYLSKGSGSISQNYINAVDQSGNLNYRVQSDINGHLAEILYQSGTSYVSFNTFWSSWINNTNYTQGGLGIGTTSQTHGYGVTIARPATSGSLYVSGSSVFTGSVGISGSINLSGPIIYDNAVLMDFGRTTTPAISTNYVVLQNITGSYNSAFFDYFASSASNFRAGTVIAGWSGSSINYTEYSTTDIGNTNQLTMSVDLSAGLVRLLTNVSTTTNWNIKSSGRYL